jgi:hypothetical protein
MRQSAAVAGVTNSAVTTKIEREIQWLLYYTYISLALPSGDREVTNKIFLPGKPQLD